MELLPVHDLATLEKALEQHFFKETLTNNYILAQDYQEYISENKLSYWSGDGNLYLFLEKEGFYRLYYLVNNTAVRHFFGNTEKIVLEIIYRGEKHKPTQHIAFWESNGFKGHLARDCYFLKAAGVVVLEPRTTEGVTVTSVKNGDAVQFAKKLIDQYLDVYTGDRLTLPEIQKYAAAGLLFCAFKDGVPCGMLQAAFKNNIFWLGHIVVHEDFRGLGIAGQLVDYYLAQGLHFQANQFQLWVISDNVPAVNLYKNKGFVYLNKSTYAMLNADIWF